MNKKAIYDKEVTFDAPHAQMAGSAVVEAMDAETRKVEEMEAASSKAEAKAEAEEAEAEEAEAEEAEAEAENCATCCPPAPSSSRIDTMSLSLSLSQSSHLSGFGSSSVKSQISSIFVDLVLFLYAALIIWPAFLNCSRHSRVHFDVSDCITNSSVM